MKKILAVLLVLAMVISVVPAAFAAESSAIIAHGSVDVTDGDPYEGGVALDLAAYDGKYTVFAVADDQVNDVKLIGDFESSKAMCFSFNVGLADEEFYIYGGKSDGTGKVTYTVIQEAEDNWSVLAQNEVVVTDGDPNNGGELVSFVPTAVGKVYIYAVAEDYDKNVEIFCVNAYDTKKAMVYTTSDWPGDSVYIYGGKEDGTGKVSYVFMKTGEGVGEVPGSSAESAISIVANDFSTGLNIEAGSTVYYNIKDMNGENLLLGGNVKVRYAVIINADTGEYEWHDADNKDGKFVIPEIYGNKLISVTNEGTDTAPVTLESVIPLGTSSNPEAIELDKDIVTKLEERASYYYKWTAENNGILNVAVSGTNGWAYSIGSDNYHSNDETPKPNNTVSVKKGDEVVICVSSHWIGSDEEGAYTVTDITLKLTFELATGEKDNPDAIGEDAPGKVTVDNNSGYYYKWTATDDGKVDISFAGTNGWKYNMSVNGEAAEDHASTDENAAANQTIEVKKGDVIIIYVSGVAEDASEISVNLAFTKNVPDNIEINYTQEDKITGAGSFNIGEDDWEWVDVEDDVVDKAVLGEDGYYHLNSKDGPILFLDMAADFNGIGIKDMNSVGRAKYSIALPEGNYENGQYKAMIDAYLAAVEDGVVALTEELMDMMQKLAVHKNWVDYVDSVTEGKVKVNPDDAWMLLCKYAVEKEDDSKDEGNKDEDKKDDSSVVEPDNKDNTEDKNDNKVPATADNSALVLSLVAMVVAMAGVAVVLTNKKKIA